MLKKYDPKRKTSIDFFNITFQDSNLIAENDNEVKHTRPDYLNTEGKGNKIIKH